MDVASSRVSSAHVSTLRRVKDMREQRARSEWRSLEAARRAAVAAEETARENLSAARERRAAIEAEFYSRLTASETLPLGELDRRHLILEGLATEIASRVKALDEARRLREKAAAAAAEGRARWLACASATHKWERIDIDVRKAKQARAEVIREIETEDDVTLRRRTRAGART